MNNNRYQLVEKSIFYLTFVIFFIIGVKSFQDYGISLDEKWHRETGVLFYNYIKGFFLNSIIYKKLMHLQLKK